MKHNALALTFASFLLPGCFDPGPGLEGGGTSSGEAERAEASSSGLAEASSSEAGIGESTGDDDDDIDFVDSFEMDLGRWLFEDDPGGC